MSGQNTMRDEFYFDAPGETFEVQRARADAAEIEIKQQRIYYAELLHTCAAMKVRAETAERERDALKLIGVSDGN